VKNREALRPATERTASGPLEDGSPTKSDHRDATPAQIELQAEALSWAQRITAAWRSTITGILEAGRLIAEAKAALPHGEFLAMLKGELPFKPSTAARLMKIAADTRLSNVAHGPLLPSHWRTLYELTKLPDEALAAKIADGSIHPDMQRRDVSRESRLIMRAKDEARVKALTLAPGRWRTLVVDPPWDYEWLSLAGRATPGYATMSQEELLALPVESWADDDAHLYLWTTNNFIARAVALMAAWGFQHKTVLTWVKPRWGLGSYFRNSTEHVLFGVRGELRTRSDSIATHFEAPVGEHSEKPEVFYDLVRAASFPPFGEAFQRLARPDFRNVYVEATP
jgi:N6-adenosine-specific RNA methylase IME4